MAATGVVLGIDLGTTATKVVAGDVRGRVIAYAERGHALHTEHRGEATHDPEQVLRLAVCALRECVARCDELGVTVRALSFSSALHTLLALDAEGRPLTPSISWADNRAADVARRLRGEQKATTIELHRATGTPVHPMSPMVKLAWFAEHQAELLHGAAHWCGLKDFVLSRLTGRLVTDHSCGSASGLMNIHDLDWHRPALEIAGIAADRLPELVAPTAQLRLNRAVAERVGLDDGLPAFVGAGDGPMANLGVGAVRPSMAAISLGTSGALRVVREQPGVDEQGRVFCYAIAGGLWVLGGAVSNGGVVAQWAAETFGEEDVADLLDEAATVPTGADGLLALPYLLGERAPWWDPDPRALLMGLRREHGRAEIVRAMVEGVCQQLALVRDAVLAAGAEVSTIRATGGSFRSGLWARVLAAALDTDLELAEDSEGSGLGAVLLGWHALGELPSLADAADLIKPTSVVQPDPQMAQHMARARPLVEQAYRLLRELAASAPAAR